MKSGIPVPAFGTNALPVGAGGAGGDANTAGLGDRLRPVRAAVGEDPHGDELGVVVHPGEVVEEPPDDGLLVVGGNDDPEAAGAPPRGGRHRFRPAEGGDGEVVPGEGEKESFGGAEGAS